MLTVKNLPAGTDPADYTIKVESEGKETVTIPLFSMTENKVAAAKCASGELADVFHITIAYKEDTILREFDYSVKQYCDTVIAKPERYGTKVVNLCKAVLDYGTYAQKAFNYNTENLAKGGNDYFDLSKIEIPESYKAVKTGAASGITKVTANLSLVSNITLNVNLYHVDDADVKDYEITLDGKTYTPYDDGEKFVFTISDIPYALLDQVHTIEIVDSDEMALTFEISPIGYMYNRNNAEFGNVYRALYNYFTIAKENYSY